LNDPQGRVLVNYDRETVGQEGGGHFSPIGAYDEDRDAFLVMDVAKFKYPAAWIAVETLFDSMMKEDACSKSDHTVQKELLKYPSLIYPKTQGQ